MMRVALVFNPRSGRGRPKAEVLPTVVESLERAGIAAAPRPTEHRGHGVELARAAAAEGFERVVAWGGDGTLNEVATGLVGSETPMGVLPGGTVNVFAREARIPLALQGAIETFVTGRVVRIPVGGLGDRVFLLMAGAGLDAEVVYRMSAGVKGALGVLAFWLDGFRLLASYPMTPIRVTAAGRIVEGTGVIAGKLARFGPRYFITPGAAMNDPHFHVVVFKGRRRLDYLRYLFGVLWHRHLAFEDIEDFKADRVSIEAAAPVRLQLDGEPAGVTPATLEVRDKALAVVLPSDAPSPSAH